MTSKILILGSGAAAAAAALALTRERAGVEVTVLDVGLRLSEEKAAARNRLGTLPYSAWSDTDVASITELPVASSPARGLPEKRSYGSDFPFREVGQRAGITASPSVNAALVSGAYGGFTNVWGAQLMPFTSATFRDWPVNFTQLQPHYEAVLDEVPFAGVDDDLSGLFPLLGPAHDLPPLSERSEDVLGRYARHRVRLNRRGVLMGRARLAMRSEPCIRCGLCMTGCPYSLIYSAAHTFDRLRSANRVTYRPGLLACSVEEHADGVTVYAKELETGRIQRFVADRVMVACGAIGSTRLVLGSLGLLDIPVTVNESTQFMLPFVSTRPTSDPRMSRDFTLNQFNMIVDLDGGHDVSQLHFYTYNDAFLGNLPAPLRAKYATPARSFVLNRLCVALGYLPSWASPVFQVTARKPSSPEELPELELSAKRHHFAGNALLRRVLGRVSTSAAWLDLWPVLPALAMSGPGKSYHWGATFPHTRGQSGRFQSDLLGRVAPWRRVHLIDGAVFPTVPATTFTLSVMANAHRIADGVLREGV